MKVVLLHDWLTGFRGGERILEALCELYPKAPIYTLIHKKGSTSPIIESREIVTSFLNDIPDIHENYRKFLPLMPLAASRLKITHQADLVISSSHCVIKGVTKPEGSKHVSYIHSPMRYIYDQFESYFGNKSLPIRLAAHACRPYLKYWDLESNRNVDVFVANSSFVSQRIKLFYGMDSRVVHPFVDLKDFREVQKNPPLKKNYYLMVTAFAPNKRVDLAFDAIRILGPEYQLKVIGSGSEEETQILKKIAPESVEFLGNVTREEIIKAMSEAKGFIFPGIEDFGITPLESLASGTPVIAFKAGGVLDTLTNKTAEFFSDPTGESLAAAIKNFELKDFRTIDLFERAHAFSKEKFIAELSKLC